MKEDTLMLPQLTLFALCMCLCVCVCVCLCVTVKVAHDANMAHFVSLSTPSSHTHQILPQGHPNQTLRVCVCVLVSVCVCVFQSVADPMTPAFLNLYEKVLFSVKSQTYFSNHHLIRRPSSQELILNLSKRVHTCV